MNKEKREKLSAAKALLEKAESIVDAVKDREQDDFDNMPESLQYSERGKSMEEAVDYLADALSSIGEASNYIDRACDV